MTRLFFRYEKYLKEKKIWEKREERKAKEYADHEKKKLSGPKLAEKLHQFLAAYKDHKDDKKYFSNEKLKEKRRMLKEQKDWDVKDEWEERQEMKKAEKEAQAKADKQEDIPSKDSKAIEMEGTHEAKWESGAFLRV